MTRPARAIRKSWGCGNRCSATWARGEACLSASKSISASSFNNDVVHGVRPIYLDAQGREQLGSLHGKDTGRPPVRVKAKKGYAVGAISVKSRLGHRWPLGDLHETGQGPARSGSVLRIGLAGRTWRRRTRCAWADRARRSSACSARKTPTRNSTAWGWFYPINRSSPPRRRNRRCRTKPPRPRPSNWPKRSTARSGRPPRPPARNASWPRKLLHGADESENDPTGRYILLKLARDAATQATDGLLAFEAIDKMAEQFQVDDVEMKTERLDRLQQAGQIAGRSQVDRRPGRRADQRRDRPRQHRPGRQALRTGPARGPCLARRGFAA